jgi:hypothetical protein
VQRAACSVRANIDINRAPRRLKLSGAFYLIDGPNHLTLPREAREFAWVSALVPSASEPS